MPRIESAVCMMYFDVPITRAQASRRCWWNAGVKTMDAKHRSRTGCQSTNSSFGAVSERIENSVTGPTSTMPARALNGFTCTSCFIIPETTAW